LFLRIRPRNVNGKRANPSIFALSAQQQRLSQGTMAHSLNRSGIQDHVATETPPIVS
jgi:hypothetical protein